jgi:hypothetical protein
MFKELRWIVAGQVLLSAVVSACSAVPSPSVPEPKLTPDDLEVFAAVINDTIRKRRDAYRERLKQNGYNVKPPEPILVGDRTLQACEIYDYIPGRCVDPQLTTCLSAYPLALQDRSRRSYSISSTFAPEILIVDADYFFTLLGQPGVGRLIEGMRRRYPQIQNLDVVYLTVPLYPRPREAVVLMRHYFHGASCLLLRLNPDGWSVERGLGGWLE